MARYISKSSDFNKTVRQPVMDIVNGPHGPERVPKVEGIMAQFQQRGLTARERELARERFTFLGLAEGENPIRRVSLYDTDEEARLNGWSDELKAEIEAVLDAGQGEWYFRLPEERMVAPWPTYDKQSPKQILETFAMVGADPEYVAAYERENKNRAAVLEGLEGVESFAEEPVITA